MPCTRHIIVCEGESEWAYLQRLQSFLDDQPSPMGGFEPPLRFVVPERMVVETGSFGKLKSRYNHTRKTNNKYSIKVWTDFDLYHRNDLKCAELYAAKTAGIPDFHFSFHNFEDFYALHWDGPRFEEWLRFGNQGHFSMPLHARDYLPQIKRIFPEYRKGELPTDFISWVSLNNLKANLARQPSSNPHHLQGIPSFGAFLIGEMERAYPDVLR